MITHSQIHVTIKKEKTEDGTFTVRLFRSSTAYKENQAIHTSEPTQFGKKNFTTEAEADADIDRLNKHFASRLTENPF